MVALGNDNYTNVIAEISTLELKTTTVIDWSWSSVDLPFIRTRTSPKRFNPFVYIVTQHSRIYFSSGIRRFRPRRRRLGSLTLRWRRDGLVRGVVSGTRPSGGTCPSSWWTRAVLWTVEVSWRSWRLTMWTDEEPLVSGWPYELMGNLRSVADHVR